MRQWKNLNKASFFLKTKITTEQQSAWFQNFCQRADDRMFVVEQSTAEGWAKIGCMGFRLLEDEGCVDAYNIIRSRKIEPAEFTFADPFRLMLAHAAGCYPELPIRCKVLSGNPAVRWYERNGFSKVDERDEYFLMEFDKGSVSGLQFTANNNL